MGTGIVFSAHSSHFQMWRSVPHIPVFFTLIRMSSGPIWGTGSSRMTRPSARSALTNARMRPVLNDAELLAHFRKCCCGLVNILGRMGRRHLGADTGRSLRDHRVEETGHI